ncbi:MAG: pentapeptide repeat-containing protein [Scytonema sp. PMC 1069.18]|nr:pentapeptide repeat-containing protein [Scytonema sp. PMC 1069.18]MEC4888007.1 pentapeptide repeat-containing protein [Scytonema sp. PMC 1070.18]
MSLLIRRWLAEHNIEIAHLREFSLEQTAGLAFRIVQDMEVKSLGIFDICTLAEVIELPIGAVWQDISVLAQITQNLVCVLSQKKPLKRNEGTWLAFQIAYLRSLQQILNHEQNLGRPWLHRTLVWDTGMLVSASVPRPLQEAQLQGLLKTLRPGKLTDTQAEQALSLVTESLLVQQLNNLALAWLIANSAEEGEAKLIIQRSTNSLSGHLLAVIAENAPQFAQLQKFFRLGNSFPVSSGNLASQTVESGGMASTTSAPGDTIDLHREFYRAHLIQSSSNPLFIEYFSLQDVYVPLKGKVAQQEQKILQQVDLMVWSQQQLSDLETVAVIESEPGYGKTSFCQIWAVKVARELYPTWIPILIRLSEVTLRSNLEETLSSAFKDNFHINFLEWLEQDYPKCLLLLDGLDELPPSYLGKRAKVVFLEQLVNFQVAGKHKIFLTSRSTTLHEIAQDLPMQLKRISIGQWEQDELRQWFQQWSKVQSLPIAQNLFTFLKHMGTFGATSKLPALSTIVRQPLMLYLLGVLHRDELLDEKILQSIDKREEATHALLWEIYQRLRKWLLGYPQTDGIKTMQMRWGSSHIHRTQDAIAHLLQNRHPEEILKEIWTVSLEILHSGHHQIKLNDEVDVDVLPRFFFTIKNLKISRKGAKALKGWIAFSHTKLGEFLCADALVMKFKGLTDRTENAYGEKTFVIDSLSNVAQYLYNLLGYGLLSQELEDFAIAGLRRFSKQEFSFELLCHRLLPFWYAYCRGRWLDEGIAHQALAHFRRRQNPVNIEQVNAALGLNIFLLLCAIHQEAKIPFSPCGYPASLTEFNPEALTELIGRTAVLEENSFTTRTRLKSLALLNLSGAHLSQVTLLGANCKQTNLSDAKLMGANLAQVNLQNANLTRANLTGANLTGANLTGANLTEANLTGVNLSSVILTNACLSQAILSDSERETALQRGAIFSMEQFQVIKNLLSQQPDVHTLDNTNNTVAWIQNIPNQGLIESVEGEPILPGEDLYQNYNDDDETVVNPHLDDYDSLDE